MHYRRSNLVAILQLRKELYLETFLSISAYIQGTFPETEFLRISTHEVQEMYLWKDVLLSVTLGLVEVGWDRLGYFWLD